MKRTKSETRKREILYGDFITEAARLLADAFDHSLDRPETLVNLYTNLGRIRLFSSDAVYNAAEECCNRVLDVTPDRTGQPTGLSPQFAVETSGFSKSLATLVASSCAIIPHIESRRAFRSRR